jgi:hypothetical protein
MWKSQSKLPAEERRKMKDERKKVIEVQSV